MFRIISITILLSITVSELSANGVELVNAALNNDIATIKKSITNGANINSTNNNNVTMLMAASIKGNRQLVGYLLEKGANPNILNSQGIGALYSASMFGYPEIAKHLLKKGAKPNIKANKAISTPLMSAVVNYNKEIVVILLNHGAEVNIKNPEGKTAMEMSKDSEIYNILIKHKNGS